MGAKWISLKDGCRSARRIFLWGWWRAYDHAGYFSRTGGGVYADAGYFSRADGEFTFMLF